MKSPKISDFRTTPRVTLKPPGAFALSEQSDRRQKPVRREAISLRRYHLG